MWDRKRRRGLMPITTVAPRRLYRQVADQLRRLIDSGEFAVGSRLPTERELAVQLGISRPTVREALIALEVDGRVSIRVGSGIFVLPPPAVEPKLSTVAPIAGPFDVLSARALFEGAVAEQAATVATPADIERLDAALRDMRGSQHPGGHSIAADKAFHIAVADILGNDAVTKIVGDLFDQRTNPYFAQLASYFENGVSWQAAVDEHAIIRDRIAAGDGAGAKLAMRSHLELSGKRFSRNFGGASDALPEPKAGRDTVKKSVRDKQLPTVRPTVASTRRKLPR